MQESIRSSLWPLPPLVHPVPASVPSLRIGWCESPSDPSFLHAPPPPPRSLLLTRPSKMKLYLRREVAEYSYKRWGSEDGLAAEKARRDALKYDRSLARTKVMGRTGCRWMRGQNAGYEY